LDYDSLLANIRVGNLNYYNFYNSDIDPDISYITSYYNSHPKDNADTDQKVSTLFLDIEVYQEDKTRSFNFTETKDQPISAITIGMDNKYYAYIYLMPMNADKFGVDTSASPIDFQRQLDNMSSEFHKYFIENNYLDKDAEISIFAFSDELVMIQECWKNIKRLSPLVLSGWNSDTFDYPYIYNRLCLLGDKQLANSTMSELGFVSCNRGLVKIPEYSIFDLLHAYKPRAEGGLNYGETLASYSLDFVSDKELGIKKVEYKGEYGDLMTLYEQDPKSYLLYNIADVILCAMLDSTLEHIDLHNGIRRRVKCGFSKATIGSSALHETFVYNQLSNENKLVRHGVVAEKQKGFAKEDFDSIPKPVYKKAQISPAAITQRDFSKISCKFDGAYVTDSRPRIIKGDKLVLDLDATSLYPSMMLQSNISFDSYVARIIPTTTYKMLAFLESAVGKQQLPQSLLINLFELIVNFVNDNDISPKQKNIRDYYFSVSLMLTKIFESKVPMENIYNPRNDHERVLLQQYLIPVLDIMNTIHPEREAYNNFVYDHLFGGDLSKYSKVYIFKNAASSKSSISILNTEDALKYLSNYSVTVAGVCFYTHEDKVGLFTEMLQNMGNLRKQYRAEAKKYEKGTDEFHLYNTRQKSIKVLMNSVYGVFGLSSYRYSNHWLAHAITTQGRTTIKIAQYLTEKYLKQSEETK